MHDWQNLLLGERLMIVCNFSETLAHFCRWHKNEIPTEMIEWTRSRDVLYLKGAHHKVGTRINIIKLTCTKLILNSIWKIRLYKRKTTRGEGSAATSVRILLSRRHVIRIRPRIRNERRMKCKVLPPRNYL